MYEHQEIEKKWQNKWLENKTFKTEQKSDKPKRYILVEFPYPSGEGLHVGHPRGYTALDIVARKRRQEGYNVLFPMGWDSFGLPAENYAIKNKIHPKEAVAKNVKVFKNQLMKLGLSFDWDREITTSDENYYKWTQWQFLKFYEHGLAYKDKKAINFCPSCKVGLSNEDCQGGICDRCDTPVEQLEKEQWMLKMSEYSQKLLDGLDETEFSNRIKLSQQNWIGKKSGAEIDFKIKDKKDSLKIFTTRPDTLYGVTFMVIAPEHPIIETYKDEISNLKELNEYKEIAKNKTEFERIELAKEKTGVKIEGLNAINPLTKEDIPIYISDYVMMNYGTGAIMAVPAHDDRDFEFAKKFNIPIKQVLIKEINEKTEFSKTSYKFMLVIKNKKGEYLVADNANTNAQELLELDTDENFIVNTDVENIIKQIIDNEFKSVQKSTLNFIRYEESEKQIIKLLYIDIEKETNNIWINQNKLNNLYPEISKFIIKGDIAFTNDGAYINSPLLEGINNKADGMNKIFKLLESENIGSVKTTYNLQDWVFSRQRFWGEPIPMIKCECCGWVKVPYEDLPVKLPDVASYEPTETGESPLALIEEFVNTTCPKCNKPAKRETDTMPNWAGSSWYYLRYMDPHNNEEFVSKEALDYFNQVDLYNGGMEHVTRHLLYSRFWHRFLYDINVLPYKEPFRRRTIHGLILASDGNKMSKSKGNTVNPNDVVTEFGADALRLYEMFIGDYETDSSWNSDGLKGCRKFLDRVYRLQEKLVKSNEYSKNLEVEINKTIKKVSEDIENFKFNTAIASLMALLNKYEKENEITTSDLKIFVLLLYPFAPHICEEINEINKLVDNLTFEPYPNFDESKLEKDEFTLIVQINGKMRSKIELKTNISDDDIIKIAMQDEKVLSYIENKEIIKTIVVKNKLINIVIK